MFQKKSTNFAIHLQHIVKYAKFILFVFADDSLKKYIFFLFYLNWPFPGVDMLSHFKNLRVHVYHYRTASRKAGWLVNEKL